MHQTCPRVYRAVGWKMCKRAKSAFGGAGKKATVALASTVASDDVIDHITTQISHDVPQHDAVHLTLKFILAFIAAFASL
jgi:hypothetical protein